MNNLTVTQHNGQNVVDSRLIAKELGIDHRSFIKTIKKYLAKLEAFGRVGFEITPSQTAGGVQNITFCYLNEDQATLIKLSHLQMNTFQKVCELKKRDWLWRQSQTVERVAIAGFYKEELDLIRKQGFLAALTWGSYVSPANFPR